MIKKIFSLISVISLSNIIYSANLQADDLATFDEFYAHLSLKIKNIKLTN